MTVTYLLLALPTSSMSHPLTRYCQVIDTNGTRKGGRSERTNTTTSTSTSTDYHDVIDPCNYLRYPTVLSRCIPSWNGLISINHRMMRWRFPPFPPPLSLVFFIFIFFDLLGIVAVPACLVALSHTGCTNEIWLFVKHVYLLTVTKIDNNGRRFGVLFSYMFLQIKTSFFNSSLTNVQSCDMIMKNKNTKEQHAGRLGKEKGQKGRGRRLRLSGPAFDLEIKYWSIEKSIAQLMRMENSDRSYSISNNCFRWGLAAYCCYFIPLSLSTIPVMLVITLQ